MIVSSASPEDRMVSTNSTLLVVQWRFDEQARHADHAVHGRADLMAHVGQELALGLRRGLGGVPRIDQRGLGGLLVRHVAGDADEAGDLAVAAVERELGRRVPRVLVLAQLVLDLSPALHHGEVVRPRALGDLWREEVELGQADGLLRGGEPDGAGGGEVAEDKPPLAVHGVDVVRDHVHDGLEQVPVLVGLDLGAADLGLSLFVRGDVADVHREQRAALPEREGLKRDLGRDLLARGRDDREFLPLRQRGAVAVVGIAEEPLAVGLAVLFGDDAVGEPLADERVGVVT